MAMKGIPYGVSDYATLTRDNLYYVDKTHFIPLIEQAARFFFLIRPRRFGKSLLLSMLESYYDINNADRFEELFGNQYIYTHSTDLRAKFMILKFNFSAVSSDVTQMKTSFEEHCRKRVDEFADKYAYLFSSDFVEKLAGQPDAANALTYINDKASRLGLRIYLIIDEYDNFTNTILSTYGQDRYREATHGEGFFRFFFNVIKAATTGSGMALERMFITGVSPITLDDVTSGFNIGSNMSADIRFNSIVGFTEPELRTMLEYYKQVGSPVQDVEVLLESIKPWYNNYCFSSLSLPESVYNSDMVLYYLNTYLPTGIPPEIMVDDNIRTDYNKIRHLIRIDKQLGVNFSVIREIVDTGQTTAQIKRAFPAESMTNPDNFKSLLYYFGMLTISGTSMGDAILTIPNRTVREQLYTYLIESYQQTEIFAIDLNKLNRLMRTMATDGNWQPVFAYIAEELENQSRIREFIDGEAHVKGFLLAYLGLTNYYLLTPEWEARKGYADFYFRPNPAVGPDLVYAYLLEVKYAKRDDPESKIAVLQAEAHAQLEKYATEPLIAKTLGQAKLKRISVVFRGWEIVAMDEMA